MATQASGYTGTQRGSILASAIVGYTLDSYNLLILTFAMPAIGKSLGLSGGQLGIVASSQLIASVVGGVVFGWFADRRGRRAGLVASIVVFSIGALVSAFAWNFWSLTLFRFITGIGLGGEWGLGMALFNEAWNKRRGLGSSIIQSCIPVGSLLAGLVAGTIIANQGPDGWRWALASGFIPVVVCIAIRFAMPESKLWQEYDQMRRTGELPGSRGVFAEFRELTQAGMRRPLLLGFMLVGGYMLAYYGVTTFMPTMIVHNFHQHVPVWKDVNTYAVWIVIPIKIAFGAFGDRLGRKFAALGPIVFMLVASVGYLAISTSGFSQPYPGSVWQWNVFWIFFIWSAGNASTSSLGAWLSETFPTRVRATGISTAYMLGRGLGGFAPILVPLLAAGNWARGMGVISLVGSVVFVAAAILLPETRNRVLRAAETVEETAVSRPAAPVAEPT